MATLQIELEDMAGTSWWAGVLATLASQSGNAYLRFVGYLDGHRRYKAATFPAPRTLGHAAPQEAWAPGMTKSLQDLRREIENLEPLHQKSSKDSSGRMRSETAVRRRLTGAATIEKTTDKRLRRSNPASGPGWT
jgi:hypothetical protein